ncbi:MAG: ArnT family glycosyltransferase [Bdellovibrionia bacterium]
MKKWMTLQTLLKLGVLIAVSWTIGAFYHNWQFGLSSDSALIGLMSRSILERGERPIFVWSVGYQGILLEAYATALAFSLFGTTPQILNLFNTLCLIGVFAAFFLYIRQLFQTPVALLSVLFLALSTPSFYALAMRTQPNYTETFLFGLLLCFLSDSLLQHFYIDRKALDQKSSTSLFFFGLIAGFGAYTYGQIGFFLAAIALQVSLAYFRHLKTLSSLKQDTVLKYKSVQLISIVFGLHFLFGLIFFLLNQQSILFFGKKIGFSSPTMMVVSVALFALGAGIDLWLRLKRDRKSILLGSGLALIGYLIGKSPQYYYVYVQKGTLAHKTALRGGVVIFLERLKYAFWGTVSFLNLDLTRGAHQALGVGLLFFLGLGLYYAYHRVRDFISGRLPAPSIRKFSPLLLLPAVVLPIFCSASSVTDALSARYTLVLLLHYALVFSLGIVYWIEIKSFLRFAALALGSILLINNVHTLQMSLKNSEQGWRRELAVLDQLQARGIHRGYADYWLAYGLTFLSHEKFIWEPLYSNYCPFYGPLVRAEKRVAYLDFNPPKQKPNAQGLLKIYGVNYRVLESWSSEGLSVSLIEKASET